MNNYTNPVYRAYLDAMLLFDEVSSGWIPRTHRHINQAKNNVYRAEKAWDKERKRLEDE